MESKKIYCKECIYLQRVQKSSNELCAFPTSYCNIKEIYVDNWYERHVSYEECEKKNEKNNCNDFKLKN
jgi:late competence protein required for DNA uptake (superfamily II DNA/RNA helicase)